VKQRYGPKPHVPGEQGGVLGLLANLDSAATPYILLALFTLGVLAMGGGTFVNVVVRGRGSPTGRSDGV
jgi:hypothetical protein